MGAKLSLLTLYSFLVVVLLLLGTVGFLKMALRKPWPLTALTRVLVLTHPFFMIMANGELSNVQIDMVESFFMKCKDIFKISKFS